MPLTPTVRRMLAAREIKLALAEAEAELENADVDSRERLEGFITALRERLNNRRSVVMAARQASLLRGMLNRRRRFRRSPVWGFPAGYNPNQMGDRCDICRAIDWSNRPTKLPDLIAWSCNRCPQLPSSIPD